MHTIMPVHVYRGQWVHLAWTTKSELLNPRWDLSSSQDYLLPLQCFKGSPWHFAIAHLYSLVESRSVRENLSAQEHNTRGNPGQKQW